MKKITSTQFAAIRSTFKANMHDYAIIAKYGEMVDNARLAIEGAEMRVKAMTDGYQSTDFFTTKQVAKLDKDGNPMVSEKTGKPMMMTVIVRKDIMPEGFELPVEKTREVAEAAVVESETED